MGVHMAEEPTICETGINSIARLEVQGETWLSFATLSITWMQASGFWKLTNLI
jgi:hypothetical protein